MSFDEIIEELYLSPELDTCIMRNVHKDQWDDFKQELFITIYGIDHSLIVKLHESKQLKLYVAKIIINQSRASRPTRNNFNAKYNQSNITYDTDKVAEVQHPAEFDMIDERRKKEEREMVMVNEVRNNLDHTFGTHYYRTIVELIQQKGSIRAVSRMTGIPKSSLCDSIKKIRNHLRSL